jgi:hypothetical protein
MRFAYALIPALLFSLVPAQAQQAAGHARRSSGMSLQTGAACTGISREECCGQKIEAAGLRAQGDYPSHVVKTTVALACSEESRVVTPQVCRSIVMSRGFAANEVEGICGPAQRECHKDGTCRKCVSELSKLDYQGSFHACQAVTYVPERAHTPVVVLRSGGAADGQTSFEITRRRTVLR